MKTIEEHRIKIKEMADLAFANAMNSESFKEFKKTNPKDWTDELREKFIIKVHEGFKEAQNLIIQEVLLYQDIYRKKKKDLKDYRRKRDKTNEEKLKDKIGIVEQRLYTLSHLADGIAWQLIGGEIHIARRFHIGEKAMNFLDSSNLKHAIEVSDQINEKPLNFALLSDLTSYIQIGDLLIKSGNKLGIMELKEGKVNDQINDFFRKMESEDREINEEQLEEVFDETTIKQAKRMLRQKVRAENAAQVINEDIGTDPWSGQKITVSTPNIPTIGYHELFNVLRKRLEEKIWAYDVVEDCLYVGMYRDEGLAMARTIEIILKKETENFAIVDWLSITNNLSQPIFAKPFDPDFIIDVLTGKIKIIIGLNVDRLIELFNDLGIDTRWLSKKETAKAKQKQIRKDLVIINQKAIAMKLNQYGENDVLISGGIFSKILFDNVYPSNIANSLLSVDDEK